ncbi:MAG: NAD(P)H-binding protein, partial [Lachnospiraceae bacterium]|nr:NAD(P)H-binding protein [Lachnospiraceae bacterium]
MKVTIFGAAGGVGKWALKHALNKGYEVRAFVRNASKITMKNDKLTVIEGSIKDETVVYDAVKDADAVIWCVGIPIARNYPGMDSYDGHKVLFKAMQKAGVKRLIDWGTPTVPFKADKKSFITVVPGMIASVALTKAKKEML